MFKEIQNELLSIMSDDTIERIAHLPSAEIAKTMDLIYNIKFENIQRVYTDTIGSIGRIVVIYDSKSPSKSISQDLCPIDGKLNHITLIPSNLLNKDNDAITLSKVIIEYISIRVALIMNEYSNICKNVKDNIFDLIILQSVPVITCAVIRNMYTGHNLAKLIYTALSDTISTYKKMSSERGIESILDLLDEGLGVAELIDNGYICSIPCDDKKYPGIWCKPPVNNEKEIKAFVEKVIEEN